MYQEIASERDQKQKHAINSHYVITFMEEMRHELQGNRRDPVNNYTGNK